MRNFENVYSCVKVRAYWKLKRKLERIGNTLRTNRPRPCPQPPSPVLLTLTSFLFVVKPAFLFLSPPSLSSSFSSFPSSFSSPSPPSPFFLLPLFLLFIDFFLKVNGWIFSSQFEKIKHCFISLIFIKIGQKHKIGITTLCSGIVDWTEHSSEAEHAATEHQQ